MLIRMPDDKIVAIIPVLNEEEGIGPTIDEIKKILGPIEIVVVDGKSVDKTIRIAEGKGAKILYQDGKGKGDALAKVIQEEELDVDYVVLTDGDFTYPAAALPYMLDIIKKDPKVGMVCGNRFFEKADPKALKNLFYVGNRFLAFMHNALNGVALDDPLTGLRVVRADVLRGWNVKSKGFDVEVELNHHVERKGFTIKEYPIRYRARLGEKKLKMRHGATILNRIVSETFY